MKCTCDRELYLKCSDGNIHFCKCICGIQWSMNNLPPSKLIRESIKKCLVQRRKFKNFIEEGHKKGIIDNNKKLELISKYKLG